MKKLKTVFPFVLSLALLLSSFNGCKRSAKKEGKEETQKKEKILNQLTKKEKEEGWKLLFDGENFEGWRGYNDETFPDSGWVVESNSIRCIGSGLGEAGGKGGDIIYDQKFKDFHLKFEWKISKGGNSGVLYLAEEISGKEMWKSAPEFQILDNVNFPVVLEAEQEAAALYDLISAEPQNTKQHGEWNEAEIMVYHGTVVHKQNGEKVLEYHLGTKDWIELVKHSKFKHYKEFGKYRAGYIGLQDHGSEVWYRNIMIKEI